VIDQLLCGLVFRHNVLGKSTPGLDPLAASGDRQLRGIESAPLDLADHAKTVF
jgi:hypothetical protein